MRKKFIKGNLLLVLILVSLIIIGIAIFTNFLTFMNFEKVMIQQLIDTQSIKTESAANKIENHIVQVKNDLVTLTKFPLLKSLDINSCSGDMKIIHENINSKINSLLRIDKEGNIIECSTPDFQDYVGLNVANIDYFKIPKETNEPYITSIERQGQIIVTAPLFETTEYTPYPNFIGEFKGALMSIIEFNYLYNLYLLPALKTQNNHYLIINAKTNQMIDKSTHLPEYEDLKLILPELKDGLATIVNIEGLDETIFTVSNLILGSENWKLILITPIKTVNNEILSIQYRLFFSLGFVVLVICIIVGVLIFLKISNDATKLKLKEAQVTLEKLGINIEIEQEKFNQADITLESKKMYLIKEDHENHAYELFINTLNNGFAGLGLVRDDPKKVKEKYNLFKTPFIWLTNQKIQGIPCETNIENLFVIINQFIKKSQKSVILIDRLDYLIKENGFENVIKKLHALKDSINSSNSIVILSINPELVLDYEIKAMEAETIDLYGKHLKSNVELSSIEMGILNFVNEHNIVNRLVSYKDITLKFNITKPTTRAKISRLENLGLLSVEQRGRVKAIKASSAGRKILG